MRAGSPLSWIAKRRGLRQILYPVALYLIYVTTRFRSTGAEDEALRNARYLVEWERDAGWLVEKAAQDSMASSVPLAVVFNLLYVIPHFLAVLGFLWWAYHRRPAAYPFARNVFYLSSLVSFVVFVMFPVAPPSAVPELAIINTMATYGPVSYEMGADPLRNTVAAMPSVHIVYAAIAGIGFAVLAKPWWIRTLAVLYIPLSVFVIVVTGNHFLVDAAGAAVPLTVAAPVAWLIRRASPWKAAAQSA